MGYRLSNMAAQDLFDIFIEGTTRFGLKQAETYHELLERTFEFLAAHPEAARLREEISPAVRIHPVQSHLVVYMAENDEDILVIRVRHAQEDWLPATGS